MSPRFKAFVINFFKVFNAVGLALLIALTFIILNRLATQAKVNHDDVQTSTNRIEADLNCLGHFFSQTNRTNLKINSLQDCTIIDTTTGQTKSLTASSKPTVTSTEPEVTQPLIAPGKQNSSSPSLPVTTSAPPDPAFLQPLFIPILQPLQRIVQGNL